MQTIGNTLRKGVRIMGLVMQVVFCTHLARGELKALPVVGKAAWQSSSNNAFPAGNAVDGDINTFSHTGASGGINIDSHPTWQLDLGGQHCLGRITVTLRQNCCGKHRFTGALVRAGVNSNFTANQPCGLPATRDQASTGATNKFVCDPPRMAKYVSLDIDTSGPEVVYDDAILQLAEVTMEKYSSVECASKNDLTPLLRSANFNRLFNGGLIGNHNPLSTEVAKSLMSCSRHCIKHARCFSFDFASGSKTCHLHSLNSTNIAVTSKDGFSVYVLK